MLHLQPKYLTALYVTVYTSLKNKIKFRNKSSWNTAELKLLTVDQEDNLIWAPEATDSHRWSKGIS